VRLTQTLARACDPYWTPAREYGERYFGLATRKAVQDFQEKHNLSPSGVVDERTAWSRPVS